MNAFFRTPLRRAGVVAFAAIAFIAASTVFTVGWRTAPDAQAVAGVPGTPVTLFIEDFENNGSTTVTPPVTITGYVGASGQTYSASPFWSDASKCNGIVVAPTSAPATAGAGLCAGYTSIWNQLKVLSGKLSNAFGKPGDQFTVASYTAGNGTAADVLQAGTNSPIPLPPGGAYLTAAVDTAAYNCNVGAPNYYMYLTDAEGIVHTVASGINPCTDPDAISDNSIDNKVAKIVRTVGDAPQLIDSASIKIKIENQNTSGSGNDATFDNIQLLDVSPKLDKSFESPVPYGSTSTITFTVTNTYSPAGNGSLTQLDPKRGWNFTDQLPAGLTIVGTPTTGAGAEACANFSPTGTGETNVVATGDLSSGQAYCTVLVEVAANAPGSFTNLASDVETTGMALPSDASVTFTANPQISLLKSSALNDTNTDGVASVGDTISYSFVASNIGNVPLINTAISDAFVGAVTCASTSIPVGGSVVCTADAPHIVTQADIDAGKVINTATVTAADSFNPSSTVNASSSVTTSLPAAPKLELVKAAGTPVDVNASGLVDAGDTIQYTFTVTNAGNVTVNTVAVTDTIAGPVTCDATTLAPAASTACSADAVYVVTEANETAGSAVNTASVSALTPSGTAVPPATDSTTTAVATPAPSLSIVKSADTPADVNSSGLVDAGDTIQYRFVVTNTGNVPVSAVAVTDDKAGSVTCDATFLVVSASTNCVADAVYVVTEADEAAGSAVNVASAAGLDPDGGAVTSPTDSTTTAVSTPAPSLSIVKSADTPVDVNFSGLVDAGDTIRYRFVVTNTGNVPISAIAVTDDKAGSVTCDATTLAVGASTNCAADAVYVVTEADEAAGSVVNVASAAGLDPDGGAVTSPTDSTTTAVSTPAPSLSIVKSADSPVDVNFSGLVDAGDTIQYRFVVTNTGNVPISAVAVVDDKAGSVTCDATSLVPGASTACVANAGYAVTEADEAAGSVVNTASATGSDPDSGAVTSPPDSTTSAVATPAPSLVISKSADTPVDVNSSGLVDADDTILYRFVVTNNGNVPISGVSINDPLVGSATCEATSLAVGATTNCVANAVYTVTEADEVAAAVVNTASASGADPDGGTVTSNTDSTSTAVSTPAPSLTIDKSADTPVDVNSSGITDAGDTIVYRFVVTNNGNVPISGVSINDPLVGSATCEATSLAVGATTNCVANTVYAVTEADEVAAAVVNTASASGVDPDGGPVSSNTDSTSTPVTVPNPSLTIDKSADTPVDVNSSGITDAGDTIVYRFVVTNNGNVPISGVSINDDLIGSATCEATTLATGASTNCVADSVYTVTEANEADGAAVNVASASGVDPDGGPVSSNTDSTSTPVTVPNPSLSIDKSADAPTDVNSSGLTDAGDTIVYHFVVTNNGNVPVSGVAIDDPSIGTATCVATTLAVGESTDCVADDAFAIYAAQERAGEAVNVASVTGVDPDGGGVVSPTDSTTTPVDKPAPSLAFTKTAGAPTDVNGSGITDVGDTIQYTFMVTNTGNLPIHDVVVSDARAGSVTCLSTTLAVGGETQCAADVLYTITAADEDTGAAVNTASASGRDPDNGGVASNTDSTSTPVDTPAPVLALTKTAGTPVDVNASGLVDAGDTIQYTFTVTNTGNVPITGIRIEDPLAGAVTCSATTLTVGAVTECSADDVYVITDANETAAEVVNSATASGNSPDGDAVVSNMASTTTPITTPAPSLAFVKSADTPVDVNRSGLVDAGDTIQYRFTVTNTGNVPVTDVTVTDDKVGTVTCDTTTLAVGDSTNCVADTPYTVADIDETEGSVVNIASATALDPDGGTVVSPTDQVSTPIDTPTPAVSIVKSADAPVDVNASGLTDAGDTIQYRFVVTNTGNVPVTAVGVNDQLVGPVTCEATTLAVGASTNCVADAVYTITDVDEAAGVVTNTATATGLDPDLGAVGSEPSSTTTPVAVPAPSLVIDKSADASVDVNASGLVDAGDTIQYRFVVTNNGNVPLTAITIGDDLAGSVTCESTTLAIGETTNCAADAVYTITKADVVDGKVVNLASASATDPDGDAVTSNTDSVTVETQTPMPSLVIDKTADKPIDVNKSGMTDAGDTIQYRFVVTNNGNVPLTAVAVKDPRAGSVTCEATSLEVGANTKCVADLVYVITGDDQAALKVINTATALAINPDGGKVESEPDSTTTAVRIPRPALRFDKTADAPTDVNESGVVDAGDTIQYRFVVTNIGDVPISKIVVNDELIGAVNCESTTLAVGASTKCLAAELYTITAADEKAGLVRNVAHAGGTDPQGATVKSAEDSTTTPVSVPGPSLVLEKFAAPAEDVNGSGLTDAGDTIRFSFTVTNNGDVPIDQVVVNDPLVGSVTCADRSLAVGERTQCVADRPYVITDEDQASGTVRNVATAGGSDPDGEAVKSDAASTTTAVETPAPGLSLVKEAVDENGSVTDGPFQLGDDVYFRFTVTNTGNVAIRDIEIVDAMIGPVTCESTTLAVGTSTVCKSDNPHKINTADVTSGLVTNTATVVAAGPAGEFSASASAQVTVGVSPVGPLPQTGAGLGWPIAIGSLLTTIGSALLALSVWGTRRRRAMA